MNNVRAGCHEIVEEALWICSALRLAPETNPSQRFYSEGRLRHTNNIIDISSELDTIPLEGDYPCWFSLVDQTAIICRLFPIPDRTGERGLEVPLDMICQMACIRHAVEFQGGIIMKGPSALLIPIRRHGNTVQWHFISNLDDNENKRFSFQDGLKQCESRVLLDELDLKSIHTTRAIVGWCSEVHNLTGSHLADYSRIGFSCTKPLSQFLKMSGGAIAFHDFSVGGINFTLGRKDCKLVYRRSANFSKIITLAGRQHVVVYDTEDKRAWLVNADDVILYIVQARIFRSQRPTRDEEEEEGEVDKLELLQYTKSAAGTLRKYEKQQMTDGEDVNSATASMWSLLETLLDWTVEMEKDGDKVVKLPCNRTLMGFELMGVAEERTLIEMKQHTIGNSSGGWARLVKDTSTPVLFVSNIGNLLIPGSKCKETCPGWQEMPRGIDYLGTTVAILKDYYSMAGSRDDVLHLTSTGLFWKSEMPPFEPCNGSGDSFCSCNRLQGIARSERYPRPAPALEKYGGVVFGDYLSYSAMRCFPKGAIFGRVRQGSTRRAK